MESRFKKRSVLAVGIEDMEEMRQLFTRVEGVVNDLLQDGREKSIVMTHLEEACMWANKGLSIQYEKE